MPRPASMYDEYFRAYSVAMLPGKEREQVSYGGKSMFDARYSMLVTH